MAISETAALERIARVLCGQRLSANAEGSNPSAADAVDAAWPEHIGDATAVLKTLREPDAAMAAAGDPGIWDRMIHAALGDSRRHQKENHLRDPVPPAGTDPLHEGP